MKNSYVIIPLNAQ